MNVKTTLPTDSATRKRYPMLRGALRYAPAAWAGMARISINGNDKHNPGEDLHHARGKSMDHGDCILRHLTDAEDIQVFFERGGEKVPSQESLDHLRDEVDQLMWRTALYVQQIHEKYLGAPLAPGARLTVATAPPMPPAGQGPYFSMPGHPATPFPHAMNRATGKCSCGYLP